MKKLLIATAATMALAAPQAFAQSKNFEGFSLALNINATSNKIDSSFSSGGFTNSGDATTHSNILSSQLQYNLAAGDKFVLGVGASMGHGILLVATFIPTGEQIKLQDTASLYIAPGIAISDTTLVYGKVASISAKTTFAGGDNLTGTGYGIGVQFFGNANVFYQVELMQNNYKDNYHRYLGADFSDKYTTNALLVGIGYKF